MPPTYERWGIGLLESLRRRLRTRATKMRKAHGDAWAHGFEESANLIQEEISRLAEIDTAVKLREMRQRDAAKEGARPS